MPADKHSRSTHRRQLSQEHRNAIKLAIVADYNRHIGHVDNADRMANSYTLNMEVDKKALFPPAGPGHCQQLHPFIFMWWEENLTQRFSTHPYQRDAGTGCA